MGMWPAHAAVPILTRLRGRKLVRLGFTIVRPDKATPSRLIAGHQHGCSPPTVPPTISPTCATLEAEAVHVMREVAAEFERPVLLFSGGKDSIVLLRLAEKAFRPAPFPFPVMHVDTGHNFPEAIEFRDRRIEELGERLIVASVEESIRSGRAVEQTGPARVAQRAADGHAAGRDRRARLRRRVRRSPPRRGARARQGAHPLLPRRVRPVGAPAPASGGVEPLQWAHSQGRACAGVSDLQLDRARRVAVHSRGGAWRCRRSISPTSARCSPATACSTRVSPFVELMEGEEPFTAQRALPHGRGHELHRRRRVRRGHARGGRR